MAVEGSRFQPGGIRAGLFPVIGMDAGAAHLEGPHFHTLPDAQAAGALGGHQSLVAGKAEEVDAHSFHVNGHGAGGLGSIHNQQQAMLPGKRAHRRHIHHVACQIGGMGADNGTGIGANQRSKIFYFHPSQTVGGNEAQFNDPLFFQTVQGTQNGVVF